MFNKLVFVFVCLGFASPAFAQFELAGSWAARNHEFLAGDGLPVDFTGIPMNEEGRTRALSYSESQLAMTERQCQGWPAFYFVQGPFGLKIWTDTDPVKGSVISYTIGAWEDRAPMTIWMDGRPHPSNYAEHTRAGFTTGRWEGNVLVAYTTHMQAGFLRKTGAPSSDQATLTTRFSRHGDVLTVLAIIEDPIYLAEPWILSKSFQVSPTPISPTGPPCVTTYEANVTSVPHYAPEKNPFVDEMTMKYGVPREAAIGVPETLYPEYRKKLVRTAPGQKAENAQSRVHVEAAMKIAGNDAFLMNPYNFFCIPGNARPNNVNAPELEPVKIFDNLYAVGNSEATVYALTTSDGILLIDSGFADRVESVVVPGLKKLGLDPAKVKYILLGHGHADHFGGSKYFQDQYGTKVGLMAADWDLLYAPNANPNQARPKKDLVLLENQPVKLGDLTVTPVAIPGHTPGSVAFIFPVKDRGKARVVGLFGGTVLTVDRLTTDALKQYVASIAHYLDVAKTMKVEVELQNHAIFDGTPERLAKLKSMKAGDPNPFIVGTDRYLKMWNIVSECIQAEIARR
jgi:metallo-beta-lactamase class B